VANHKFAEVRLRKQIYPHLHFM